jgi:hypothetical protein
VGIGLSIFVIVVGAILAFALEVEVAGIDLSALGVIVMLLGVVALGWTLYTMQRGATRIVRYRRVPRRAPRVDDETTRRRVYDDRPPA